MTTGSTVISLLQITDTHIMASPEATLLGVNTAMYFNRVLEFASQSERKFDLCLITGDLAQDPFTSSYEYLLKSLENYDTPCLCLPGNHDDFEIMRVVLSTDKVNCTKRVVLGNWQIINLNSQIVESSDGYLAATELSYLENTLSSSPDLFTLIAVHHNSVPCESDWMDVMMIKNAKEFFGLVNRYPKVKVIINGHIHQAMDVQVGNVRILSTPSTCFQFKPKTKHFTLDDTSPGFRRIALYDDGAIKTEVIRIPEKLTGLQMNTEGY